MKIYDGTVIANGGEGGAGIGGGIEAWGGKLKVTGGTVIATGGIGAAGIGGGYKGACVHFYDDNVSITGGTVIAKAGEQGGDPNKAFGPGKDYSSIRGNGPLEIGDNMRVGAGNNGTVEKYFPANERKKACWYRSYAEVSPCPHDGCTYTVTETTHTRQCNYCTATKAESHIFENGKCIVCNYETDKILEVVFHLPDLENEEHLYREEECYMVPSTITLPVCDVIPDGYEFEGWTVNTYDLTTYEKPSYETLLEELSEYPITGHETVTFTSRFKKINVTLYNDQFNGETLFTYDKRTAAVVTLDGRTLYKDGNWNTLCLPFSLTAEQLEAEASPLAGGDIRTLSSASFSNGTLTLNFTDEGVVTSITAGTPYIVKWPSGSDITTPTFTNVTFDYTYHPVETEVVTFQGNFNPVGVGEEGDNTMLFLGDGNTLYYPNDAMTINAFRAYFKLNNGLVGGEQITAGGINNFVLNFGDETGLTSIPSPRGEGSDIWYAIDGRKLSGKPTQKGI